MLWDVVYDNFYDPVLITDTDRSHPVNVHLSIRFIVLSPVEDDVCDSVTKGQWHTGDVWDLNHESLPTFS